MNITDEMLKRDEYIIRAITDGMNFVLANARKYGLPSANESVGYEVLRIYRKYLVDSQTKQDEGGEA